MKNYLLLLIILLCFSCKKSITKESIDVKTNGSILLEIFQYSEGSLPIISVHRGGSGLANFPENCLETLQYVNDSISAIFEIDVAKTKDGVLVLMHDNTLERTSTGFGRLDSYTVDELQAFNLVDDFGKETSFKIPKFTEVLAWAKNNEAILTVDIKRTVDVSEVIKAIREEQAEDHSIIITYDIKQALKAHELAPDLLLSVSARNQEELNWLLETDIPTANMIAFTGTRLSDVKLYETIHKHNIKTILGTLGNLDKQAEVRGDSLYKVWHKMGIDAFATDRPFQVASTLNILK